MLGSLAKGARWTAGRLFSDLNPNNKTESIIDHRYHADFASFNESIENRITGNKPNFTRQEARNKLIEYRELVKKQYELGSSVNSSLQHENDRVMEHVMENSKKNDSASLNITTVTPVTSVTSADDNNNDEISSLRNSYNSSSSRSRSSSILSVGSSTSRGSDDDDDGSGYWSARSSFASDSSLPPPPLSLSLFPEGNSRPAGTEPLTEQKQQLFSASTNNGLQGNKLTQEQRHAFQERIKNLLFAPKDGLYRVAVTSSGSDQPRESESIPLSAVHIGGMSQAGIRSPPHQR